MLVTLLETNPEARGTGEGGTGRGIIFEMYFDSLLINLLLQTAKHLMEMLLLNLLITFVYFRGRGRAHSQATVWPRKGESQKTTCGSHFLPSSMWVLRIELGDSGLTAQPLSKLSHLTCLESQLF